MERYWVWEYGLFEKNPKRVDSLNPETTLEVVKLSDAQATVEALQRERDEAQALVSERASMIGSLTAALRRAKAEGMDKAVQLIQWHISCGFEVNATAALARAAKDIDAVAKQILDARAAQIEEGE